MKPFNLAEARIVERSYCQEHIRKRVRVIAVMIAITMVIAGASSVCKLMLSGRTQETKSRLADIQERHLRIKREMSIINNQVSENKWQGQLAAGSCRWLGVLDAALGSVPENVWLDSVKNSDKDSSVAIAGKADSFDAVTAFIASLRCRKPFSGVQLESAKADGSGVGSCVDFTLTVTLKDAENGDSAAERPTSPAKPEPAVKPGKVPEVQGST